MAVDYLAEERVTAQFDVQTMKVYLAGGQREHEIATKMAHLVANDPVCTFHYNNNFFRPRQPSLGFLLGIGIIARRLRVTSPVRLTTRTGIWYFWNYSFAVHPAV